MIYENMLDFFYIIQYKCTDWESVRTGKNEYLYFHINHIWNSLSDG